MADSEAKWYIRHTYSGYENKVATDITKVVENRNLQNLISDVAVPTTKKTVTKDKLPEAQGQLKALTSTL